jgi:hypothetical protein
MNERAINFMIHTVSISVSMSRLRRRKVGNADFRFRMRRSKENKHSFTHDRRSQSDFSWKHPRKSIKTLTIKRLRMCVPVSTSRFVSGWNFVFSKKRLDYSNRSTLALVPRRDCFAFLECKAKFFVFEREAGVDISSSYIFLTRWWHKK